jgi:hypothetical protein
MRAPLLVLVALLALPAAAQQTGAGGNGKQTGQNLRSFTIENNSKHPLASVTLLSTDGGKQLFQTSNQIQPNESAEAQVGRDQCLAEVDATFKGGRTLRSTGLHDCKMTRVSVDEQGIKLESAAVH